jgi:hypothetical protein
MKFSDIARLGYTSELLAGQIDYQGRGLCQNERFKNGAAYGIGRRIDTSSPTGC